MKLLGTVNGYAWNYTGRGGGGAGELRIRVTENQNLGLDTPVVIRIVDPTAPKAWWRVCRVRGDAMMSDTYITESAALYAAETFSKATPGEEYVVFQAVSRSVFKAADTTRFEAA